MKIKKAFVFGETKGLDKTSDQSNFKPYQVARQRFVKSEVRYVT
jgi:hypothetical protein